MEIDKVRLVVFDLETTNPPENYQKHEIIEIAAVEIKDGRINKKETFHSLVKPPCKIQPHNFKVSGISDEMVRSEPTIKEVLPKFLNFVGDSPLIAHNRVFDGKVLSENMMALSYGGLVNPVLCTFILSKKLYPDEKKHGLDTVRERLGIVEERMNQRHRALSDVEITAKVFLKFLEILKRYHLVTVEDINQFCTTNTNLKDLQQLELF